MPAVLLGPRQVGKTMIARTVDPWRCISTTGTPRGERSGHFLLLGSLAIQLMRQASETLRAELHK